VSKEDTRELKKARKEGRLAEALLDRRRKLKRCVLVLFSHPRSSRTSRTCHVTLFRFDRPNRSSKFHNPFHTRRPLYSHSSDWFAATDSADDYCVSAHTRALTSQSPHSLAM